MKRIAFFFVGLAVATGWFCSPVAVAQDRMAELPGYRNYQKIATLQSSLRGAGQIRRPHWSDDGAVLYFTRGDERLQINLATAEIGPAQNEPQRQETESPRNRRAPGRALQSTVETSPDGKWKAAYRDFNVVLEPNQQSDGQGGPSDDSSINITTEGSEQFRFGTCCWVYGEELFQNSAMWWSPDSRKLAFYEIDERHMKPYLLSIDNTEVYPSIQTEQYPTAGEDNPNVALLIYDLDTKSTTRVNIPGPPQQYLYNVAFSPDGSELLFHRTNRWQNQLDVVAANPTSGETRIVVSEKQDTWQNNSPTMRFLEDGLHFVWETESNGWKHFELRHLDGRKVNALSQVAEYPCESIVLIDEANGWFYYTAYSGENPLNQHLHRVRLDGSDHRQLTSKPLNHSAFEISPDHQVFTARYESVDTPPVTALFDMQGEELAVLAQADRNAEEKAGLPPADLFSFTAADGETIVYGVLQKPAGFDPEKTYPLLIDVYGGPLSRGFSNNYLAANPFCEFGFLIAKISNRGTVGRGKAFEAANYLKLGGPDLEDQADGVRFLAQRHYVDGSRVGIFGHSYGGYMSALAVLKYPDVFHVAVAGAPVTDWKNYDTIYTERYMRTPSENPDGYRDGACLSYIENLTGNLFLLHGLVDDNVHPSNTWQLIDALQRAGKRFDLMIYPRNKHGFNYNSLRWEYLVQHLKPQPISN